MRIKVLHTKRRLFQFIMYLLFLVGITSMSACKTTKINHHDQPSKYGPPSEEYQKK
jgi:hypothetical protein